MGSSIIRPTFAEVNLDLLIHNFRALRTISPGHFFCPMIKANAYGHGDFEVCQALSQLCPSAFGVGLIEEALRIREKGITRPILFFGAINKSCLQIILGYDITPVISDWEQLELLKDLSLEVPLAVHIKINTGMHRYGFNLGDVEKLNHYMESLPKIQVEGIMTHLSCGEDFQKEDSFSKEQLTKFERAVLPFQKSRNLIFHIFNTTGLISYSRSQIQSELSLGARPGIGLYGYAPDVENNEIKLSPVLSLYSQIVHMRKLRKGESVSYGRSWFAKRDSIIGIVPIGYADGLPRALSNKGKVIVRGQLAPIVGNVTMDNIMIDLTDLEEAQSRQDLFGAQVTLIGSPHGGPSITAGDWANLSGTIEWEILTRLSERVPRIFIGGSGNEKNNN